MQPPYNPSPVRAGDILAGKYRIDKVLGEGGMGVVVAATHTQLNQKVALKFLLPAACQIPEAVERFLREARAAVRIQSEHVARVIDVGTMENGAPYMVMEFLSGHDLNQEIAQRGPMPVEDAANYLLQAIEAIAEAHALGIVHRDLKPANLFRTTRADGSALIKVLDFGISKYANEQENKNLTATTTSMGSPLYMSPEQVRSSKNVDPRTDVWALGVIFHELLAGQAPFDSQTVSGVFAQIIADPPPPIRNSRPDVPAAVQDIILHCLVKDREQRIPNVAELAKRLAPYTQNGAASAERTSKVLKSAGWKVESVVPALPGSAGRTGAEWSQTGVHATSSSRSNNKVWIVVAAVVALLGVGGGAYALLGSETTTTETENTGDGVEVGAAPSAAPAATPPVAAPVPTSTPTPAQSAPPAASGVKISPITEEEHAALIQAQPAKTAAPAPKPASTHKSKPAAPAPRPAVTAPKPAVVEPAPAPKPKPKPSSAYNPLLDGR